MQEQNNRAASPVQPRHLHLVEFRPSHMYYNKELDKQTLLNHLLANKFAIEFNFIIIARETTNENESHKANYKVRFLLNLKYKSKSPQVQKLIKEAIQNVLLEPIRDFNEITIKSVQTQIDAISSITKYDMNFLHTGASLNPNQFNIRFKIYKWCVENAHLDVNSNSVKRFVNNNKKKMKIEYIINTFENARNNFLLINNNISIPMLVNESISENNDVSSLLPDELLQIENSTVNIDTPEFDWENIDFNIQDLIDPDLLRWIETSETY